MVRRLWWVPVLVAADGAAGRFVLPSSKPRRAHAATINEWIWESAANAPPRTDITDGLGLFARACGWSRLTRMRRVPCFEVDLSSRSACRRTVGTRRPHPSSSITSRFLGFALSSALTADSHAR